MTKQHFSFKEIFMFGWAKTQQHAWFIALTFIIIGIIFSAVVRFPGIPGFASLVYTLTVLSICSISLAISRNHHFTFADLFTPLLSSKRVLKYLAFAILYAIPPLFVVSIIGANIIMKSGFIAVISFVLFILAMYIGIRFLFYPFVVVDHENAKFIELIKMSYRITSANFLFIVMLYVALVAFNMLGAYLFGIGLLVTVPISTFMLAHVYNRLIEHHVG